MDQGTFSEFSWTGFWGVPACFVLPISPAQCRGWSGYSGRSIVAQDVFSEFWAGFGVVPSLFFRPAAPPPLSTGPWSG